MLQVTKVGLVLTLLTLGQVTGLKIIDLSHKHGPNTLASNYVHPKFNRTSMENGFSKVWNLFVEAGWFSTSEHAGTHIDAPGHTSEGSILLDEVPLEYLILEGVMIDCAEEAKGHDDYGVTMEKMEAWEEEHGRIPDEAAILFNFNWSRKFDDELAYKGTNDLTDITTYVFPYVSEKVANWLLKERKPRLIASDTLTPDPIKEGDKVLHMPIHRYWLKENRLIVENLRDPWQLPARGFRFHAAPVAYKRNTGAQVRAFAIINENDGNGSSRPGGQSVALVLSLLTVGLTACLRMLS